MIEIREEQPGDLPAIRVVHERAFDQSAEANIVEKVRANCSDVLSLVALRGGQVVGHILFSPATVEADGETVEGMGLAPMAVLPACQREGIGSALVRRGLEILAERCCPFVIVLGHPEYYPRFGFERACAFGLRSQWEGAPDEAFMAVFLDETWRAKASGIARYREEFDEAM
jgi:putative acetyltransferase